MTENLTVTKEAILAAASKCPTAKDVLKTLFPDVFEQDTWVSQGFPLSDQFYCFRLGYVYKFVPEPEYNTVRIFSKPRGSETARLL